MEGDRIPVITQWDDRRGRRWSTHRIKPGNTHGGAHQEAVHQ